jgi:hypothetical protein
MKDLNQYEAAKFTPGPWEAILIEEGLFHIHSPKGGRHNPVPVAVLDHHRDGHEETRTVRTTANARLIAAAPELYEALKEIYLEIDGRYDGAHDSRTLWMGEHLTRIEAAIRKAEGRQ